MEKKEIIEKIHKVKSWGHRIKLPHGIVTPGRWSYNCLEAIDISPNEIKGKTVLDVGALDGQLSFLAEAAGASRVVAVDIYENFDDEVDKDWYENIRNGGEAILTAKEILNSKVEIMNMNLYDLSPEKLGKFDIVFFLGVLYHLKYPLLALEKISSMTDNRAIIGSHIYKNYNKLPFMLFTPGIEADDNPTNWWFPNPSCLKMLVKSSGFVEAEFANNNFIKKSPDIMSIPGKIKKNSTLYNLPNGDPIDKVSKGQNVLILGNIEGLVDIEYSENDWIRIRIRDGIRKVQGYIHGDSVAKTISYRIKKIVSSILPDSLKNIIQKIIHPKLYNIKPNIIKGFK